MYPVVWLPYEITLLSNLNFQVMPLHHMLYSHMELVYNNLSLSIIYLFIPNGNRSSSHSINTSVICWYLVHSANIHNLFLSDILCNLLQKTHLSSKNHNWFSYNRLIFHKNFPLFLIILLQHIQNICYIIIFI